MTKTNSPMPILPALDTCGHQFFPDRVGAPDAGILAGWILITQSVTSGMTVVCQTAKLSGT